jgi:anti-sigma factor RsiW
MVHASTESCDEALLDRYLNSDLSQEKESYFLAHLETCSHCRQKIESLTAFREKFVDQVDRVVQHVDFTALEKDVLTTVIHHSRSNQDGTWAQLIFKFILTSGLIAGILALLAYMYLEGFFGL